MKALKKIIVCSIIISNLISLTGCWNYREINQIAIVSGVAVDKNKENNKYILTIEIVNAGGGKDMKMKPDIVTMEGNTIFDAVRNAIEKMGRRLYWSHAKVAVISQDIAKDGVVPVIDFFNRDAEIRTDIWLLVSKDKTASEVLMGIDKYHSTLSFHIAESQGNAKSVGKYVSTELWQFVNDLGAEGISAVLPFTMLVKKDNERVPELDGTAVFKKDKMIGMIDNIETRSMLFVKNKFKNGVVVIPNATNKGAEVTLEIMGSKAKVKPVFIDEKLSMKVDIEMDSDIAEIMGSEDVISKNGRGKLQKKAEETIKKQIDDTIKRVQDEYKSDIFGFGNKIQDDLPNLWKKISKDWDDMFSNLDVEVNVKVNITGSALNSKPIKMGD